MPLVKNYFKLQVTALFETLNDSLFLSFVIKASFNVKPEGRALGNLYFERIRRFVKIPIVGPQNG